MAYLKSLKIKFKTDPKDKQIQYYDKLSQPDERPLGF